MFGGGQAIRFEPAQNLPVKNHFFVQVLTVAKADWGAHLETGARRAVPVVAFVITMGILTFEAGRLTRQILHIASEALAAAMAMAQGVDEQHHRDQVAGLISLVSVMAFATVDYFEKLIAPEPVAPLAAVAAPPKPPAPPVKKSGSRGR